MLAAAVDAVDEVGYAGMTVAQVIGRARVSRKTFYDVFSDREDCFPAVFEQALEQSGESVLDAYRAEDSWREGVRAGLATLLALMDDEPALTKLCVVEALAAGDHVLERRAEVMDRLAQGVDGARSEPGATLDPPSVTAEGVVGAVFQVLHSRVLDGNREPLFELLGPLMSMIVLPYLGTAAARRELQAPVPERQATPRAGSTDPLRELDMRLTYRTVRVLTAIAELSGHGSYPSNRQVGVAADMHDQGQVSKLLTRLHRLGLIQNSGLGPGKGAPNAWTLTPKGHDIQTIIGQQAN
jgi:AcrR family transcriptional regulator